LYSSQDHKEGEWVGHVARIKEIRNTHKSLIANITILSIGGRIILNIFEENMMWCGMDFPGLKYRTLVSSCAPRFERVQCVLLRVPYFTTFFSRPK
jgi:hypothetical protein